MRTFLKFTVSLLTIFAMHAQAALVSTDWKVDGDKKAVLDTDSGIEWLRLEHTQGKSIESILPDLLVGGEFAGWRLPTQAEVVALITRQFGDDVLSIPQSTSNSSLTNKGFDIDAVRNFATTMGGGYWGTGGYLYSGGYFKRDDGQQGRGGFIVYNGITAGNNNGWYFNPTTTKTSTITGSTLYAVYLVSDGGTTLSSINNPTLNINNPNSPINLNPQAPEPQPEPSDVSSTWALAALMLIGLPFRRRKP